jgi:hypothetical protein
MSSYRFMKSHVRGGYCSWMNQWTQSKFCKHVLVFLVMANTIHVILYLFVVSIQKPPFIFASWFLVMMFIMTINHYKFLNAFPFCDEWFHIVLKINNFQASLIFYFLCIDEWWYFTISPIGLFGLPCFDF